MPPVKSIVSKCRTRVVKTIVSLSEIMPSCSYYAKKKLLYIAIAALSSRQPSFYSKYTKSNIRSSCNV